MRYRVLPALLLASLSACSTTEGAGPAQTAALPGPVIYEVNSWGTLLTRWEVRPDGSGEIWRGEGPKGGGPVRKYRLRLDAAAMQAFIAPAEELRKAAKAGIPCKKEIFDLPYGSIVWDYPGDKQTFRFDSGCRSKAMDDAAVPLHAAQDVVEKRAAIDPEPYETQPGPNR